MTDLILQQRPKKLILIEKDVHLVKYLKNKYKEINNILIIEKDILSQFWNEERTALLDGIDKASMKTKSPYELVDEIKGKDE